MTEKPRFKRAFSDLKLEKDLKNVARMDGLLSLSHTSALNEVKRCYEIIAEAERMAEYYGAKHNYDSGDVPGHIYVLDDAGRTARQFLERLS
jgi:hypothetical protein